jgi:hypothetical protein
MGTIFDSLRFLRMSCNEIVENRDFKQIRSVRLIEYVQFSRKSKPASAATGQGGVSLRASERSGGGAVVGRNEGRAHRRPPRQQQGQLGPEGIVSVPSPIPSRSHRDMCVGVRVSTASMLLLVPSSHAYVRGAGRSNALLPYRHVQGPRCSVPAPPSAPGRCCFLSLLRPARAPCSSGGVAATREAVMSRRFPAGSSRPVGRQAAAPA